MQKTMEGSDFRKDIFAELVRAARKNDVGKFRKIHETNRFAPEFYLENDLEIMKAAATHNSVNVLKYMREAIGVRATRPSLIKVNKLADQRLNLDVMNELLNGWGLWRMVTDGTDE